MDCPCKKNRCEGENPNRVLQIINEGEPVLFHSTTLPASVGTPETVPPESLPYKNVLLTYESDQSKYLYNSDGIPTLLTKGDWQALSERVTVVESSFEELQNALSEETNAREQADAQLNVKLEEETEAREAADEKLAQDLQAEATAREQADTALDGKIATEASTREVADTNLSNALQTEIEAREAGEQANASAIEDVDTRVTLLGTDVEALESAEVQTDTAVSADASTVTITKTTGQLKGTQTPTDLPMPVANAEQAGVMNPATYNAIQENTSNIDAIEGGAVALGDLPAEPTQEQLTEAWKTATGRTELINRASIFDTANNKLWYYYTNDSTWHSVESGSSVTVSQATNDSLGIVKGSTTDGQVAVESDGSMSLNGWDGVQHDVQNLVELTQGRDTPIVPRYTTGTGSSQSPNSFMPDEETVFVQTNGVDTQSGRTRAWSIPFPTATTTKAGVMPAADKSKLDSLLAIKSLNDSLSLDENGQLSVVGGGGSSVNLLTAYTAKPADGDVYVASYMNDRLDDGWVRIGKNASTPQGGTAVGSDSRVQDYSSVAIGSKATANGGSSVAIGGYIGALPSAKTTHNYGIALGPGSTTSRNSEVSIGGTSYIPTRYLANVKAGELDTDAVNVAQLNAAVGDINTLLETLISGEGAK